MFLSQFRHPTVRNLAWVLLSSPLLQKPDTSCYWPTNDLFHQIYHDYLPTLQKLEKDPTSLIQFLNQRKTRRLGHYFEALLSYWLQTNEQYQLILEGTQIRERKRTIGELDFIVYDKKKQKYYHWEVAIKIYLGRGDTTQYSSWSGPNKIDRLDKKYNRMISHQIPMSKTPSAQKILKEKEITIDESWIILKGWLFYPSKKSKSPIYADPQHAQGSWKTTNQFLETTNQNSDWIILPRRYWLAPIVANTRSLTTILFSDLCSTLLQSDFKSPICVAKIQNQEVHRSFIVPNLW
ncbi:MAG: hypothetical protein ACI86H_002251 [bacterium]|jgi:hypothetical protein